MQNKSSKSKARNKRASHPDSALLLLLGTLRKATKAVIAINRRTDVSGDECDAVTAQHTVRMQAIADEATRQLPATAAGIDVLAAAMGMSEPGEIARDEIAELLWQAIRAASRRDAKAKAKACAARSASRRTNGPMPSARTRI